MASRHTSFRGQSVLLTGGTDGMGRATLIQLIKYGAEVTVVGRSAKKWDKTRSLLSQPNKAEFVKYDLSVMRDVKSLGETILQREKMVNIVVHCAGVMLRKKTLTEEGLEEVFAVQYLARFYLNQLLAPHLESVGGKVLVVSAGGSIKGIAFDFENLQGEKFYSGVHALKHESVANDTHILSMAEIYPKITWYNYGPGVVRTSVLRDMGPALRRVACVVGPCMSISPIEAADDVMTLLSSQRANGLYVRGLKSNNPSGFRSDPENQAKLGMISEQLVEHALNGG